MRGATAIVSVMRGVPAAFTLSLWALGGAWIAAGRTTAGLVLLAAGAGAAMFGLRIMVASRLEATSRRSSYASNPPQRPNIR